MAGTNRRIELTIDNLADYLPFEAPWDYAESIVWGHPRTGLIDEGDPLVSKFIARYKARAAQALDGEGVEYVLTPFEAAVVLNACIGFVAN